MAMNKEILLIFLNRLNFLPKGRTLTIINIIINLDISNIIIKINLYNKILTNNYKLFSSHHH